MDIGRSRSTRRYLLKVIVDNNFGTKYKVLQNYEHWLRISCWLDTAEQIEVRLRPIEFRMKISNIFHLLPILLLFCMLVRQLLSTMIFFLRWGPLSKKLAHGKSNRYWETKTRRLITMTMITMIVIVTVINTFITIINV